MEALLGSVGVVRLVVTGAISAPVMVNSNGRPSHILVVDGVEETRDSIEQLLTADGYRVSGARNEDNAVCMAQQASPDLILVCLGGPVAAGIAMASRIRRRAGLGDQIPVIMFCVETVAEAAEVEVETNIFATRPDNFDQLRMFVGRLLNQCRSKR